MKSDVSYQEKELLSATVAAKSFGAILDVIGKNTTEKVGILRSNKLAAVIISPKEYARLKASQNILEHLEIAEIVAARKKTPRKEYVKFPQILANAALTKKL